MSTILEFIAFPKMARLSREVVITEKIDGTNAQIAIGEDGSFHTGSRNRWITPDDDNYGFSRWAHEHRDDLMQLGPGRHFGEWWGQGIQRGYGLTEKRFSLFNVGRWNAENIPACCHVVPTISVGVCNDSTVEEAISWLRKYGSEAAPGFMRPEGIIIYHTAARVSFKKTLDGDGVPKSMAA
ncbi:RNA ligase family protein [Luteibacter sp. E-22]|uniref:RNA ligase family protein n=1 Tax=Luteibacter sp. E-22 TaxID=3404050 RepID=UPI003CF62841